ncbi:hypothetical protein BDZ94DRAFT_1283301 [Collybia nuda]|uniref:Uncharacterized protein n=1 Tax=Collybia nuda TaxID=64659 RepID=A0A9P6CDL5_9AGAR|nr:hypothetical protein BDZ94DRAFT_1283301 [Collybia nuda]
MLAQRALSLPRCLPRAQLHTRPTTFSGRVWYRSDGTPRSRLKGLLVATLAGGTLYTMYAMLALIDEFDTANYLLSCLIHIQRADADLSSVDLSDERSTLAHFRSLCASFGDIPQHMIDDFFDDVAQLLGSSTQEVHKILREVSEAVHEILVRSKGRDPWETATEVIYRLDETIMQLVELVEDKFGDEEVKVLRNQKIKEQVTKDPASRNSDYEVVG